METEIRKVKRWIMLFIVLLVLSGVTAFPLEMELKWLAEHSSWLPYRFEQWIRKIYFAVEETNLKYPQLAYGTDWLAFAHLVIAGFFIKVWLDPLRHIWVLQYGMIVCVAVIPLALICGEIRSVPFYWRLIDCSFGVFGFIPLSLCFLKLRALEDGSFEKKHTHKNNLIIY
jgi:hypothetical protein